MAKGGGKRAKAPIVIRREEIVEGGGHHGGAWKVAYADFVTAMMAFFLLMWLINATTEKQRRGLADYFSPQGPTTRAMSGNGKPFGGLTPYETGALVSNRGQVSVINAVGHPASADPASIDTPHQARAPSAGPAGGAASAPASQDSAAPAAGQADPDAVPIEGDSHLDGASGRADATLDRDADARGRSDPPPADPDAPEAAAPAPEDPAVSNGAASIDAADRDAAGQGAEQGAAEQGAAGQGAAGPGGPAAAEAERFSEAADAIRRGVATDPALAGAGSQVSVESTPTELRVQIVDSEHRPMFPSGSAMPDPHTRALLAAIAPVLARLGAPVSVTGHTDSATCGHGCVSNWSLSAARADAARAVLEASGLPDDRLSAVTGLADRDPLVAATPLAPENRRIVMVVPRRHPGPAAK